MKERRSGHCEKCGVWRQSLHREHKIPKFKGGTDDPSNIQWICANCHEDKTREDMKGRDPHWARKPRSKKVRLKISIAHTGKKGVKKTPEQCEAISKRMKESCASGARVSWNKGKTLSAAGRKRMSRAQKESYARGGRKTRAGQRFTDEQRARVSAGLKAAYADGRKLPTTKRS